jgi:hypothetical protein
MSKENTSPATVLNIDEVKTALNAGTYPVVENTLSSQRLRAQLYAMRPTVLEHAALYSSFGYDVEQALALCEALLTVVGEMGAKQFDAKQNSKSATRERKEARAALIAAKEAMVTIARMSQVPTAPFESEMTADDADPIALGQALIATIRMHAHTFKHPVLVERVKADVEAHVAALIDSMKAQHTFKAKGMATTQEKRLAKGALLHTLQEISRLGRVIFSDDREIKRALSLKLVSRDSKKKKSVAKPNDDVVIVANETDTPVINDNTPVEDEGVEPSEVEVAVIN